MNAGSVVAQFRYCHEFTGTYNRNCVIISKTIVNKFNNILSIMKISELSS